MAQNTEQQDTREQQIKALMIGIVTAPTDDALSIAGTLLDGPVARMIADAEQAAERVTTLHCSKNYPVLLTVECANEDCDHEGECPTRPVLVCAHCVSLLDLTDPYWNERHPLPSELFYPCPTVRAARGDL